MSDATQSIAENLTLVARICDKEFVLSDKQIDAFKLIQQPGKRFIKLWGGGRGGKTFVFCLMIALRAAVYSETSHVILRHTREWAKISVWEQCMLPILRSFEGSGYCKIVKNESRFINGSIIRINGCRAHEISSVLSAEHQTIYLCEGNENAVSILQKLFSRLNVTKGKGLDSAGKQIVPKFFLCLNPTTELHWSYLMWMKGVHADLDDPQPLANYNEYADLHFTPFDNPLLDPGYIEVVSAFSKWDRLRFLEGKYGSQDGLVYPMTDENLIDSIPERLTRGLKCDQYGVPIRHPEWRRGAAIDFGLKHPFVFLAGVTHKEHTYFYKEHHKANWGIRAHAEEIKRLFTIQGENLEINDIFDWIVADHDAGQRENLHVEGIITLPARKDNAAGVSTTYDEIERNTVHFIRSGCPKTALEMAMLKHDDKKDADISGRKPFDGPDDGPDTVRYYLMKAVPPYGSAQIDTARGKYKIKIQGR